MPLYVMTFRPDFVIMHPDVSTIGSIPGIFVCRFVKVKFVLDVRSTPVETVGFRGLLEKLFFTTSIVVSKRLFDGITVITPLMKKELCESYGLDSGKVGVWTSGVSRILFNPKDHIFKSVELRRELGLAKKFIVFYHGGFSPTRGLTETVEAIELLRRTHPNILLFLLGTGPIVSKLKELIQKKELQSNVIIHGPVDHAEVPNYIGMSDVCIIPLPYHPYWRFQCPLKLLEYLAMGKVTVATDIPAHRMIIGTEKCGIYASSIQPAEIARCIIYAYYNKEKLDEWGKSGQRIVDENYTWRKVAEDLENYLLSIDKTIG